METLNDGASPDEVGLAVNDDDRIMFQRADWTIELNSVGIVKLPTKKRIYCVLRSPHVDKDSREHFEVRTHKRILEIYYNSENNDNLFDLLSNADLPSGVFYKLAVSNPS